MGVVQNDLKEKSYKNAYLLYGSEGYLRNYYKNALKAALVNEGDNLNYSYFEGSQTDPEEVRSLIMTMPFLAEHRVVIVENSGWFSKAGSDSGDDEEGKSSGKFGSLIDAIKTIDESSIIIFSEEKADKRSKLFKAVSSLGVCEEYAEQTDDSLAKWLVNYARSYKKEMRADVAYYLVSECGKDMLLLENEMAKLVSWALEKDSITIDDVDTVCTHQINGKIFDMITAIATHRQKEALKLYYDLLTLRESPFHILTLLVKQYSRMLAVKDGMVRNVPVSMIASETGTQDWLVKKIADQVRRISIDEIKNCLNACAKADHDIKSGNVSDTMSIELLIISCSESQH